MLFAHIAGIPVEETLLTFGPVGVSAAGLAVRAAISRAVGRRAGAAPAPVESSVGCRAGCHPPARAAAAGSRRRRSPRA
jgi:hypothetical protein